MILCCSGLWLNKDDIESNLHKLSKTKTMAALKAQIYVRTKVFKSVSPTKLLMTKATVQSLKEYLEQLMSIPISEELQEVYELVVKPEMLVGVTFVQRWALDDSVKWYEGSILGLEKKELKIKYEEESSVCFMTPSEILVDIFRGDLEIHC